MCCVNGLPMQIGLNMLLQQAKPDRLLIEPTGLGHPKQILSLLTSDIYQPWIDLRATLCLLDARQLSEPRYTENENFRDQLAAADIIVANKQDTYRSADNAVLQQWQQKQPLSRPLYHTEYGKLDITLLDQPRSNKDELLLVHIITAHHSQRISRITTERGRTLAPGIKSGTRVSELWLGI